MRTAVTKDSLPRRGDKLTDGKRLVEVDEIDANGAYWLIDCFGSIDPGCPQERIQLLADELVAEKWALVCVEDHAEVVHDAA